MSADGAKPVPARPLTKDEVRAELHRIDLTATSPVRRSAQNHGRRSRSDHDDLLNEAVRRALSTRKFPSDIAAEVVIDGIMRSIASGINLARARAADVISDLPLDLAVEMLATGGYAVVEPDEIIELERVRQICEQALEVLAANDPRHRMLIDAIGMGNRGKRLCAVLGVTTEELATMRRSLKRAALRLWPAVREEIGSGTADTSIAGSVLGSGPSGLGAGQP